MTARFRRIALATLCCLFVVATSASAEPVWVLWVREPSSRADRPLGSRTGC